MNLYEFIESTNKSRNSIFVAREAASNDCEKDCPRYLTLIDQSLKFRSQPKQTSIDIGLFAKKTQAIIYEADYAIINLYENDTEYRKLIGDAGQNMINRAKKAGAIFSEIQVQDHYPEIREILTSTPVRGGKEMPSYFLDPDYKLPVWQKYLCSLHAEKMFAVFLDGRIRAYATLRFFGEICGFNFIMGHSDFLDKGVVYFLVAQIRVWLRSYRPDIIFLYYTWMGKPSYADYYYFKSHCGFREGNIVLFDSAGVARVMRDAAKNILPQPLKPAQEISEKLSDNNKKPKLFKIPFSKVEIDGKIKDIPEIANIIENNYPTALVGKILEMLQENVMGKPVLSLVGVVNNVFESKNHPAFSSCQFISFDTGESFCLVTLSANELSFWHNQVRPKISGLMQRGELVFIFIKDAAKSISNKGILLNAFKNTNFQALAEFESNANLNFILIKL